MRNLLSFALALLFLALASSGSLAQNGEKQTISQPVPAQESAGIKVVFDEATPGVVVVESNGKKIRVDTAKKTIEEVAEATSAGPESAKSDGSKTASPAAKADDKDESAYDFDKGDEPYDTRIVNIPTPRSVPKGTWNLTFTHRFSETIDPVKDSARDLFGLDSYGVASFGLSYGITDKLYASVYRSPLCQTGVCRTIEVGVGYNWLTQDKDSPIALSTNASIEGNDNFTEEFTYNLQARLAARLGKRVYLFFSPVVSINANGQGRFDPRSSNFFPRSPLADEFNLPVHGASFGFGGTVLITPNVLALVDFTPRVGFKMGAVRAIRQGGPGSTIIGFRNESYPSFGFGIQRNIGKHAFALTFSNTQATTTSRYNSSNLLLPAKHVVIGFNLSRRF